MLYFLKSRCRFEILLSLFTIDKTKFCLRQQEACTVFETMSEKAKEELKLQRERRVLHFQKSLSELAELEVSF